MSKGIHIHKSTPHECYKDKYYVSKLTDLQRIDSLLRKFPLNMDLIKSHSCLTRQGGLEHSCKLTIDIIVKFIHKLMKVE